MSNKSYVPTIGLEIHAELRTASKMFCSCKNDPDEERPNINICPICMGHPGTLPVLNMTAIHHVLSMGVALGGTLADFTEWDRKNYFYPDIPKGYQISQYKYPLVTGGELAGIALERIHLEEDTAQSTHDTTSMSLVNFNRAGVPLMELVTKPVIHDAATAVRFAKELQLLLRYLGAGEANMQKGEMRVEANISIATAEDTALGKFGTKTEIKNLNSFRAVEGSIAFEIGRQTSLLQSGEVVIQETRGWDDKHSETYSQRSKESSHDYRYFPEPDIPKMKLGEIPQFAVNELKKNIPELPWSKRSRLQKDFALTDKEVAVMIESREIADYFESIISAYKSDAKKVKLTVNYLLTDYLGMVKRDTLLPKSGTSMPISGSPTTTNGTSDPLSISAKSLSHISPVAFAELIDMIASGQISSRGAKDLLSLTMSDIGATTTPKRLAERHGLLQKSSASDLIPAIEKVLIEHAKVVVEYKAGKTSSLQFLIGASMKATRGAANPEVVKKLLEEKLS